MKKKDKKKQKKQSKILRSGFGPNIFTTFKKELGVNKNIVLKKLKEKVILKKIFSKFLDNSIKKTEKNKFKTKLKNSFPISEEAFKESKLIFLKNLNIIKNYRGIRHANKLPTRGQRSKTNAKTISKRIPTKRKKKMA